ncbi:glycosyltransferase [Lentisalinibacter orientalis]|uniref:glycosyltransferase n=1 Tax=Lentisalinibacter orientalis TaxID=2992241 RepID=UPI00386CB663
MMATEALQSRLREDAPARSRCERLRVAVVSDAVAERNGVGSYYSDLVGQLGSRVGRAELFCPQDSLRGWRRRLVPPLPGDRTQRLWFPRPFRLWRQLTTLAPHAVVVPTPGPFGLMGLLAARRLGIPLITGFHTHFEQLADIYWRDTFGRLSRGYLERCHRLLFRHSALVLANSPEMARLANRLGARGTRLMGTSVPREFLDRPLVAPAAEVRRLLFAGRLAEEKNLPAVLDVAERLPDLRVSIAGDGPMRPAVAAAAARLPNLDYLGWVPRERLIDTLDAHDMLLLPSRVESFGTVALEGMARGRPVIVSGDCGIAEWPELEGGLFRIGADESVIKAVTRACAAAPAVRAEMGRQAHLAARRLNDWNLRTWIGWLQGDADGG